LLLSSYAIRKSLVPLDRLTEATRRIAGRDFSTRVDVTSGDEFEDLADAFNNMSDRLRRQFKTLATNAEIHQAILSTIDTSAIVETAAVGALSTLDCDLVWVGVRGAGDSVEVDVSCADTRDSGSVRGFSAAFSAWDLEALSDDGKPVVLTEEADRSRLLESLNVESGSIVVAFPMLLAGRLAAVLCIGRGAGNGFSDEELSEARQLTDQVAVALSNSNLIEEMKALTWGTLEALARAIDAKSSWTGGHSERVTALSMKIAKVMGRGESELEVLHRGALLHDIGKLGISMKVLDKPGRLSDDEYRQVMSHPSIGGRILEPISAFADILPIVTEHHEKWDGTGYPNRLAGEEIDINARILSVADTWDAMTSDRPYRKGCDPEFALTEICNEAGAQFDPRVVEAFLVAMGEDPGRLAAQSELDDLPEAAGGRT
jgi:putative nucleotidyltransferase with HDIG domain